MLEKQLMLTADGSTTIHIPSWNEQYHSKHGAIQEAIHVFIKAGLHQIKKDEIRILEIGFGTGLNAFLSLLEAQKLQKSIVYEGVEAYPVNFEMVSKLNFTAQLHLVDAQDDFLKMHQIEWEKSVEITPFFKLKKKQQFFENITDSNAFDLIYFDAFGARNQPELWTEVIFEKMFDALKNNGILVTYAAKGSVRRAMQAVGFLVEKLPGPPGKREMLRATKI